MRPFYLSIETVLPIKCDRSNYQVKPFYISSETVIPLKSNVYRYVEALLAAREAELRQAAVVRRALHNTIQELKAGGLYEVNPPVDP